MAEEKKTVNAVAQWLRAEVDLTERARQLGVHRELDPATVRAAYIRAAEEIEALHAERERRDTRELPSYANNISDPGRYPG